MEFLTLQIMIIAKCHQMSTFMSEFSLKNKVQTNTLTLASWLVYILTKLKTFYTKHVHKSKLFSTPSPTKGSPFGIFMISIF